MNNPTSHPKISIVTPSLNQGRYIERTIQSVLSQDYPNLEYLVLDGGSSDHTLDILKRYSGRVKWISEKDSGQTNAINKGLSMANGEIFAYLNADDLFLPGTLNRVARQFLKRPDAMWLTGKCLIIDEHDREVRRLITAYKNIWLGIHHPSLLLITDYISQPATFWRADIMAETGLFDENLHYAMDYEYWLRLSIKYPLTILPEYLAAFRVHADSKNMNAGHGRDYIDEERLIIERATKSKTLRFLHDIHRWLMTTIYSMLNKHR